MTNWNGLFSKFYGSVILKKVLTTQADVQWDVKKSEKPPLRTIVGQNIHRANCRWTFCLGWFITGPNVLNLVFQGEILSTVPRLVLFFKILPQAWRLMMNFKIVSINKILRFAIDTIKMLMVITSSHLKSHTFTNHSDLNSSAKHVYMKNSNASPPCNTRALNEVRRETHYSFVWTFNQKVRFGWSPLAVCVLAPPNPFPQYFCGWLGNDQMSLRYMFFCMCSYLHYVNLRDSSQ